VRIRSHRDECIPRGRAVRIVAALLSRSVFVFYTSLVLARKKERKKRERGKERERERERENRCPKEFAELIGNFY